MKKNTNKFDQKYQQITLTYKELQKAENYAIKKNLVRVLRKFCSEALEIMDKENVYSENIRKKKQIQDMLKKCDQIEKKIDQQKRIKEGGKQVSKNSNLYIANLRDRQQDQNKQEMSQKQRVQLVKKSRQLAKSIIFYEIESKDMKMTNQQLDKLVYRFQKNHQAMKQIEQMIIEQGGNIQIIQNNIKNTYQIAKQANIQLDQAAKLQNQTRLLKIRLGISGFLGAIGLKIIGIPGLVFGFFAGLAVTK